METTTSLVHVLNNLNFRTSQCRQHHTPSIELTVTPPSLLLLKNIPGKGADEKINYSLADIGAEIYIGFQSLA